MLYANIDGMRKLRFNIILHAELEGGFTVSVPALPGCITYGKTLAEAQLMATDAIGAYVASLRKHREFVPSDERSFIGSVELGELKGRRVVAYA